MQNLDSEILLAAVIKSSEFVHENLLQVMVAIAGVLVVYQIIIFIKSRKKG